MQLGYCEHVKSFDEAGLPIVFANDYDFYFMSLSCRYSLLGYTKSWYSVDGL